MTELQSAVDARDDRLLAKRDDEEEREHLRNAAIAQEVERIVKDSLENPAYGAYIVCRAEVPLYEISVRLHGESMPWERAVLEALAMGARGDDPEAIRAACDALREAFAAKVRADVGVEAIAAKRIDFRVDCLRRCEPTFCPPSSTPDLEGPSLPPSVASAQH